MSERTLVLNLPFDFEDGKTPPATMRMVSRIGTMQDPDTPGEAGKVEVMQWAGGFGIELWHPDGRKLVVDLRPLLSAACRELLVVPVATDGR